jgi:hypothetical protein
MRCESPVVVGRAANDWRSDLKPDDCAWEWDNQSSSALQDKGLGLYPSSSDVNRTAPLAPRWLASVYAYPDGSLEGSVTPRPERCGGQSKLALERLHEAQDRALFPKSAEASSRVFFAAERAAEKAALNDARATVRAKASVKRFVRMYDLRRLLTFTNGGEGVGWPSRKAALDDVSRFWKVHNRLFARGTIKSRNTPRPPVPVCFIAEKGGKGGRWHVHAAMASGYFINYRRIIAAYSAFMDGRGYPSPSGGHRFHAGDDAGNHKGGFTSARHAARYLCKYLLKSLTDDTATKGEHRYRAAGAGRPAPWRMTAGMASLRRVLRPVRDGELIAVHDAVSGAFRCLLFDVDCPPPPPHLNGVVVKRHFDPSTVPAWPVLS